MGVKIRCFLFWSVLLLGLCWVPTTLGKWVWKCNRSKQTCQKIFGGNSSSGAIYNSIGTCKLVCGTDGNIWPMPKMYTPKNPTLINVDVQNANFNINCDQASKEFLQDVISYFNDTVNSSSQLCSDDCYSLIVNLKPKTSSLMLNWNTNEEYVLTSTTDDTLKRIEVNIIGSTVFGVRHGIETFLQLCVRDKNSFVTIKSCEIADKPFYKHRGLLLDTARNYLSVEVIKRNIVAMGMSKMNVLHWHLSDSQSFPFVSSRVPQMSLYGAYSDEKVYTQSDIADLIKFAKIRGVRIIPEIDGPAHVGSGWQWGPQQGLGNLVVCYNQKPWKSYCIQPPCGQLNPANPNIYKVLSQLYYDIVDLWTDLDTFHMGGDEVYIPCWNSSSEILTYIGPKKRSEETFLDLWSEFQAKALTSFDRASQNNSTMIMWTSSLTDPTVIEKYLPKDRYVIQTWVTGDDDVPELLLSLGYKIIVSTKDKWYLDHGFWGTTSYYRWREVYDNMILTGKGVLGGEVCMWGELVNDNVVEPRVWPRAAAAAERLWSNPATTSKVAENRFFYHNIRLQERGIRASTELPEYCSQSDSDCTGYLRF